MYIIVKEFSYVNRLVCPMEGTDTMLLTIFIGSFIFGIVRPCFDTISILLIFFPITTVLSSINVLIEATSMCFIMHPFPFVNITISMDQSTLAVGLVIFPVPNVHTTILPDLCSSSFTKSIFIPLTMVDSTIIKLAGSSRYQLKMRVLTIKIPYKCAESLLRGFGHLIGIVRHMLQFFDLAIYVRFTLVVRHLVFV